MQNKPEQSYKDPALSPEERASGLLRHMTVDEKIKQLQCLYVQDVVKENKIDRNGIGGLTFERVPMPYSLAEESEVLNEIQRYCVEKTRLGIPAIIHAEALHGLAAQKATSFPMALGLAATWDPDLMHQISTAIAGEVKARGIRQVLSPVVDIVRDARWGRAAETYGEDPLLTSRMAVAFCKGFEERGVITSPKHFVANSGDGGRDSHPVYYSQRLLRKIFFPPYKACIKEAGSRSLMASYNAVDGIPVGMNRTLLTDILRDEWGFKGFVVTDYSLMKQAVHKHGAAADFTEAGARALKAGLDRELPEINEFTGFSFLKEALAAGLVTEDLLDTAVKRILTVKFEIGLFENPYGDPEEVLRITNRTEHRTLARKAAEESFVLLKNNDNLLPFGPEVRKIAVLGAAAVNQKLGDYSGWDMEKVSVMDGLRRNCGENITVEYINTGALGSADNVNLEPIPADKLFCYYENKKMNGLTGNYHNNNLLVFQPIVVRHDAGVSFNWGEDLPVEHELFSREEGFSARWRGTIRPDRSGLYSIGVEASGKVKMFIDSELMIDRWEDPVFDREIVSCVMEKEAEYHITLEYASVGREANIMLGWQMTGDESVGAEKIAAGLKDRDAAIIVAGVTEGEGKDRANINLPASMEQLIRQVSGTGIPTVVLLNAGGVVTMSNWIDDADAVMDIWYSGQEGGTALADVLFGKVCPGGKLPVTFPQDVSQLPLYYNQEPSGRGYGYLEISGEPMFPFGHGLSYTVFEYRDIRLSKKAITPQERVTVSIEVANTGGYSGDEVVQLYVRDKVSTFTTPLKELKDFKRVRIGTGKTETVTFELGPDNLSLLDKDFRPVVEPGEFEIMAGSSSKDIRLTALLTVTDKQES